MLGAILKQLLERDGLSEPLRQAFRKEKRGFGGRAAQLLDLVEILKTTTASLPEVFVCIDGLDECLPEDRRELLESLRDIVRASPTTRVFLSGRPHIEDEIKRYFAEAIMTAVTPTIMDIMRYLEMKLDRDPTPSAMDRSLRAKIMSVIPGKISQMWVETTTLINPGLVGYLLIAEHRFLLVSLNIDAVLEEVTIHQRERKLDEMIQGNGLRDAYSVTLARIKAQKGSKSRVGMEVLMWLSHSERPLKVNELCHAMGVEIGSSDLNPRNIPATETLLGCSLGLVTVEASSFTVRLIHYTLQEYLSNNTDVFHSPHSRIAQVCLTYLNFQCIRDLPPVFTRFPLAMPLLPYASDFWGAHTKREITESVTTLSLRLLDGFDKHVSAGILLSRSRYDWNREFGRSDPAGFTGLHCAAYFGIPEIVVALLELKKWDLDATDEAGNTAILWAAKNGQGVIVKILLARQDIIPDTTDKGGRTPLSWAAGGGHGDIVQILIERKDVIPDSADEEGRTPLSWAAEMGRGGIVKMLFEQGDVSPDSADNEGRTPLSWAVGNGQGDIVKMLLERKDVEPDTADKSGRTPLSWAAENWDDHAAIMLLEREDVDPDTADMCDRTPLSWAAESGSNVVAEKLLEREDVNPDTMDHDGRTPLLWAARTGMKYIVWMLLERKDVSPDIADEEGRTPLSLGAAGWFDHFVGDLLERDVAPDTKDEDGRTPLSWTAENGNSEAAKVLLEQEGVTPDTADKYGRTPLSWVAGNEHGDIVKMLLEREDVVPDTTDKHGRTPLSWAAEYGDGDVVKMLLERKDVEPDTVDKGGRTPLSWATSKGHGDIVKMLLERKDVEPDTADKGGRTPLSWATEKGLEEIVKMLLERGDVAPDTADKDGQTPSSWAQCGHNCVVETLLEQNGVSKGPADPTRQTAPTHTSEEQRAGIVEWQFKNPASVPQSAGSGSLIDLSPDAPSWSSQRPSKKVRRY